MPRQTIALYVFVLPKVYVLTILNYLTIKTSACYILLDQSRLKIYPLMSKFRKILTLGHKELQVVFEI